MGRNKGYNHKKEVKENISKSLKGRRVSPKTEFTHERMAGENNWNWKGGITPINMRIRASKEYQLWRKAVFERDKFTCRFCGKIGGILHADHIKPFALFPELRFAIDNGRTLCKQCHQKTETYAGNSRKLNNRRLKNGRKK